MRSHGGKTATYRCCTWGVLQCEGKKRRFAEDQVSKGESLFFLRRLRL
jgi:hypothetical protein